MIFSFQTIIDWLREFPFLTILISFAFGLLAMPYVLKISIRKQMVVKPNKRTSHKGNIPNVGGINIFTSFLLTYLIFSVEDVPDVVRLFLGGLYLIFLVGFLDDLLSFSAKKKLIGEIVAGFILIVLADFRLTNLHGMFWINTITDAYISYFISLFLFLLIINGLNLIDGVDGLATGIGMVICLFYGIYFQFIGQLDLAIMAYSLIGALAIFFIYNVFGKRSKIFMGDSGALVLGYIIYVFVVKFCEVNQFEVAKLNEPLFMYAAPAMSVCVLAVPLFDTIRVMFTRIKKGQSPFKADKNHVHHLLLSIGLKHRQVTFILVLVNISFIALAIIGNSWKNSVLGGAAVLLAMVYTLIMWRVVDRHKKKQNLSSRKVVLDSVS